MIKITGFKDGILTVVEKRGNTFLFNGSEDFRYQTEIKYYISKRYPIGGTFVPDKDDPRNIINAIGTHFFDMYSDAFETDEEIEALPHESGVIY